MDHITIVIGLGLLGLALGSFAGATVWRLRARQLTQDKAEGEEVDEKEYKQLVPLTKTSLRSDRSRCLHCGHTLEWYDLFPLVSWLSTGGRCRYCHKWIGPFEPLIELGVAIFFVSSYLLWSQPFVQPVVIVEFIVWLISGVLLAILFAYDLKWFLLPNQVMFPLIAASALYALLTVISSPHSVEVLINLGVGIAILSGLYALIWLVSQGRWIGFGDVKLGLALALLLVDWRLALLALLLANLLGSLIVAPLLLIGTITRKSHVPFGPLLIGGFLIAGLVGQWLLDWYFSLL